jgi:hypothetical protein
VSDPKNASLSGEGFRFYRWTDRATGHETDVLSVTSIRKLCGESYNLVNWQMANLVDAALGTQKRTVIGPRGGVSEKREVFEFPSEFAAKYVETEGEQGAIDTLRKWLRERAEEPKNVPGVRGTMVHEAIEKNVAWDRIERPYVEAAFARLSNRDRGKVKRAVNDEDVFFVRNAVRHYWAMREETPMIVLAREVQCWNLSAGYAGTFDALVWLLGSYEDGKFVPIPAAAQAKARSIKQPTLADIVAVGGELVLLDWKTSKGIYTDQVVQAHAYLAAEFVGTDGVIDKRLTQLLTAAHRGGLAHIRPNGWALHLFPYEPVVTYAFLGSVAFARFLARYPKPTALFSENLSGMSSEIDEEGEE